MLSFYVERSCLIEELPIESEHALLHVSDHSFDESLEQELLKKLEDFASPTHRDSV